MGSISIKQMRMEGHHCILRAQDGHLEVVNALLSTDGIDINQACEGTIARPEVDVNQAETRGGLTPLYIACATGHLEIVKELLKQPGIDINQANMNGVTPLYIACEEGHAAIVDELLAAGANINQAAI